jgi:hypothetical protein
LGLQDIGRVCPGQYLGTASVWISIATMLATLKISKAIDNQGNEVTPTPEMTTGLERYALTFSVLILEFLGMIL